MCRTTRRPQTFRLHDPKLKAVLRLRISGATPAAPLRIFVTATESRAGRALGGAGVEEILPVYRPRPARAGRPKLKSRGRKGQSRPTVRSLGSPACVQRIC